MQNDDRRLDRRQFVSTSGAGIAALGVAGITGTAPAAPASAPGAHARVHVHGGGEDRIRVGIVGCGGRGTWAYGRLLAARKHVPVTVTALCDVWGPARDKLAARAAKDFGAAPATCARYADLLARQDVDAVVITTPDFAHSPILIDAVRAGKDAYCEKPMANVLAHANAALDAVRDSGRIVQIGTQRRSEGRFAEAARLLQQGLCGEVVAIETQWHDHNPRWQRSHDDVQPADLDWEQYQMGLEQRPFDARRYRCWHLYLDYTTGPVGLLGSHLIDVAHWFTGDPYPRSAVALGGTFTWSPREHADTLECALEYPKGWLLRYATRLGNSKSDAEVTVYGTRGTFDTTSWTAKPDGGGKDKLAQAVTIGKQPSVDHVQNWLECIRSRQQPNAPIEVGHAHAVATILAYEAWRTGRRQVWDGQARAMREA